MRQRQHLANEHFLQFDLAFVDGIVCPDAGKVRVGVKCPEVMRVGVFAIALKVGELVSPAGRRDGLVVGPRVDTPEIAVLAELRVDVDELLLKELADTPDTVTGTDEATCCDW